MQKVKYKIVQVNGYWKFHIYKRFWFGWWKIRGRDDLTSCEDTIRQLAEGRAVYYYNRRGEKLTPSTNPARGDHV